MSSLFCNIETPVTEFKTKTCSITGVMLFVEIHRVRSRMKKRNYHIELG